ncbi:unnamed protein product [Echinostoma caproni]|uniref:Uncharacterized protein n=1 Tax=Echinostoma caproni TaxID=27848 RepID=A0A183BCS9_9TREM|nr:unnamed protein product [Echinostoma caproni]
MRKSEARGKPSSERLESPKTSELPTGTLSTYAQVASSQETSKPQGEFLANSFSEDMEGRSSIHIVTKAATCDQPQGTLGCKAAQATPRVQTLSG